MPVVGGDLVADGAAAGLGLMVEVLVAADAPQREVVSFSVEIDKKRGASSISDCFIAI